MPWPGPLSGLGIRRGWSQLLYKALGVDRGRQSKGYEAKAATMTGKFLVDFSICFGPDGNEFNVGIYIQAGCPFAHLLTGLSFVPFSPCAPPVLSLHTLYFLFIHCSKSWGHQVMPLPETLLGSPVLRVEALPGCLV